MAKHALGEVDGTRGAAKRCRHDEAEDVHDAGNEGLKDAVPAGRSVGVGRHRVRDESHCEEDRRYANIHGEQGNHETTALAKLHESGHDHRTGRYGRAPMTLGRGVDGDVCGGGHSGAPSRVVT